MKLRFFFSVLPLTIVLFSSCKKDRGGDVVPPPVIPTPVNQDMVVRLQGTYLASAEIDSAFATWKTTTGERRVRMELRNDSLVVPLLSFDEGAGKMTLYIYSNKKMSFHKSEYISTRDMVLSRTKAVSYTGPTSFFDADWFPRVELKDANGNKAVFGLRPEDSYFVIKAPAFTTVKLIVEKSYWEGINGVGMKVWECTSGCYDTPDTEIFSGIPMQIGTRQWNHIQLMVIFRKHANGEGAVLDFNWTM